MSAEYPHELPDEEIPPLEVPQFKLITDAEGSGAFIGCAVGIVGSIFPLRAMGQPQRQYTEQLGNPSFHGKAPPDQTNQELALFCGIPALGAVVIAAATHGVRRFRHARRAKQITDRINWEFTMRLAVLDEAKHPKED
jgi:hypothetical protein